MSVVSDRICPSCSAFRREARHRILKLKPTLARLGAALACARRITSLGTLKAVRWDEEPDTDLREMLAHLDALEADLERQADDWCVLLLS